MSPEPERTARVEARLAPDISELIRRAAELQGCSISDFMVTAARDAAQRVIADTEILRLPRHAQKQFVALILEPPVPTAELVRVFECHRALISQ